MYMIAMEWNWRNMSKVRVYLTHLLPALQKIQKRRYSLPQRKRAIQFGAEMCLMHTANKGSAWCRALSLRLTNRKRLMKTNKSLVGQVRSIKRAKRIRLASLNSKCCKKADIEIYGHNLGAVDMRLGTLRSLVPGGGNMGIDTLFKETADYIWNLEMQVHALEILAEFYTNSSVCIVDSIRD